MVIGLRVLSLESYLNIESQPKCLPTVRRLRNYSTQTLPYSCFFCRCPCLSWYIKSFSRTRIDSVAATTSYVSYDIVLKALHTYTLQTELTCFHFCIFASAVAYTGGGYSRMDYTIQLEAISDNVLARSILLSVTMAITPCYHKYSTWSLKLSLTSIINAGYSTVGLKMYVNRLSP